MGRKAVDTATDRSLGTKTPQPSIDLERKYPAHPAAEHFPVMEEERFEELVTSIRRDGQLDAIILLDGKVLDGRHRLRACSLIGMTPRFETFGGDNPFDYVESKNIERRDLEPFQRETIRLHLRLDSHKWDEINSKPNRQEWADESRRREANKKEATLDWPGRAAKTELTSQWGSRDPQWIATIRKIDI